VQRSVLEKVKILLYHEIRIEPSFNLRYLSTFYDFGKYDLRGEKIISCHPVHTLDISISDSQFGK